MPLTVETFENGAPEEFGALFHPDHGAPRLRLVMTPYRSLTPQGFVWFIGITASLIALPLLAVLGTAMLWGLLPFAVASVAAIWIGLTRSWRDGTVREELVLWDGLVRLTHVPPRREPLLWEANPYWVQVRLHPGTRPVRNYVTLKGQGREVEIGSFLTPSERNRLHGVLKANLGGV